MRNLGENHLVVPLTRLIRPIPPADLARANAQTNLVVVPAPLKFVGVVGLFPAHREAEVRPIHRKETVVSNVPHLPVFKENLAAKKER